MKPTKMLNVKFDGAREFVNFMKDEGKKIWISCDDPVRKAVFLLIIN